MPKMMMLMAAIVLLVAASATISVAAKPLILGSARHRMMQQSANGTRYYVPAKQHPQDPYTVVKGEAPASALAWADYNNSFLLVGWDYLEMGPNKTLLATDPAEAYYVQGFLEGYITQEAIYGSYANLHEDLNLDSSVNGTFMNLHWAFASEMMSRKDPPIPPPSDPNDVKALADWKLRHAYRMGRGVMDGYKAALKVKGTTDHPGYPSENISDTKMYQLLCYMDVMGYESYLDAERVHYWDIGKPTPPPVPPTPHPTPNPNVHYGDGSNGTVREIRRSSDGHCFAGVAVTETDVVLGHVTWWTLWAMYHVFKVYRLEATITMSSAPGSIHSGDDFVFTSNGIGMTETTGDVDMSTIVPTLADPYTSPTPFRFLAGAAVAKSGKEFSQIFLHNDSGTAAADWLIVDMNKYDPKGETRDEKLQEGFFHIIESFPAGYSIYSDETEQLRQRGYVAANNRALLEYGQRLAAPGDFMPNSQIGNPDWCARTTQFRRAFRSMNTMEDFKDVMRMNEPRDINTEIRSMAGCRGDKGVCSGIYNPSSVIAMRRDVNEPDLEYGMISYSPAFISHDAKAVSLLQLLPDHVGPVEVHVIAGPSCGLYDQYPHFRPDPAEFYGYPPIFNYSWQTYRVRL